MLGTQAPLTPQIRPPVLYKLANAVSCNVTTPVQPHRKTLHLEIKDTEPLCEQPGTEMFQSE